jgi:uncharacterized cysteine cluster protein YcgN (CxxCxxCC family)
MEPFWKNKTLDQLTPEQWEALCDGCGRCCLQKLKNPTTGKVYYTSVACYLLDIDCCRCTGYEARHVLVADCVELNAANIQKLNWLPKTCAYRLLALGKPLPQWHPLVSGDPDSVHKAGISVRHRAISEVLVHPDDLENYMLSHRL